jgi:hypothetical protein
MAQLWCIGRVPGAKEADDPREDCVSIHFDTPLAGDVCGCEPIFRLAQQLSPSRASRGSLVGTSRTMRDFSASAHCAHLELAEAQQDVLEKVDELRRREHLDE